MRKSVIFLFVVIIISGFVGWFVYNNKETFIEPAPLVIQKENSTVLFTSASTTLPSANWGKPTVTSESTTYGNLSGMAISGKITSDQAMVNPYEDKTELAKEGYKEDLNLAASGPGSNVWGYKKTENGKSQVVIYSYQTEPTSSNPNEPLQFNCPCQVNLMVFISDPFNEKQ